MNPGPRKPFSQLITRDNQTILGFYSLAPGALAYADTPEMVRRGLARHDVPGFRLARICYRPPLAGPRSRRPAPRRRRAALPARSG